MRRREVVNVAVVAGTEAEAREAVRRMGLEWLSLEPAPYATAWWRRHGHQIDVATVCRELRSLVGAGLSVVESLEALQAGAARSESIYGQLLRLLQQGRPLSGAMRDTGLFPPLLVASVQASERTSGLVDALDRYLHFDDAMLLLRRKVVGAALYPTLVAGLGALIAFFLLVVVMPRFAALYQQARTAGTGLTEWTLAFGLWVSQHRWSVAAALLAALVVACWFILSVWRSGPGPWVRRVPPLARVLAAFERARFFEAMALLVRGGFPLDESLRICAALVHADSQARLKVAAERLQQGAGIAQVLNEAGLTDPVTDRLVRAGERGGQFERVLGAVAQRNALSFETWVDRATRLVEPILLLLVAIVVGGLVVTLYMPIFDIAASVR